jgi:succinyl-CoA synthetase alpha subunit
MSIFVNKNTRVIVQGITGNAGRFHTDKMVEYGSNIVAGVKPYAPQSSYNNIPIYSTVAEAKLAQNANASIIYVPAPFAMNAILEAIDANIENIICITEGIPVQDMLKVKGYLQKSNSRLIGPNCPGLITPGECKLGIMPGNIHKKGNVGVVSRSGTLTYETVGQLTSLGLGQSTCVGIGGDPIIGTTFIEVLDAFNHDNDTEAVVMIGEIGGNAEEHAADFIKNNMKKPVVGHIVGKTAPKGKRMGHAGAIISSGKGTAAEKIKTLEDAGVVMADIASEIGKTVFNVLHP